MDFTTLSIFWWIIAGVLLFLEIITPATIFIFPSVVAVFVGFLALIFDNILIQGIVFFVGSFLVLLLVRPLFVISKNDVGYKQGAESLLGKKVRVKELIDNNKAQGRIQHGAELFPARSSNGEHIVKDTWVTIDKIEGITVFVSPSEKI